jgi:serine/threonine-protein kinase
MGSVYEAEHAGTGRRVAIKVISTGDFTKDAQLVGRFQREAKAAGKIDTEHICQVLDTGTDPKSGLPYMVMEFMTGEDVSQLFARVGVVSTELALKIVGQACLGLGKAHAAHVIHRDIKPANLFLAKRDGGEVLVKVLDFGIAKVKMEHASDAGDAGLTRTGTMLGSPLYMSPEQARGSKSIDHRADIWSLGVVLYQALSGRTPYHHIDALGELIIAICSEPPRPVQDFAPWVPKEVAAIVHKALRADPNERYQTANEMYEAVKALLVDGVKLEETQLVGITEAERANVGARLSFPPAAPQRPSIAPSQYPPAPGEANAISGAREAPGGTNGGVAATNAPTEPKGNTKVMIAAGVAIGMIGAAVFALKVVGGGSSAPATAATSAPSIAAAPASAPVVTPGASSGPSVTPEPANERMVKLVVIPEDATVTVDGNPATVKRGVVEIKGALGTVHKVKLAVSSPKKAEMEEDVSVTESGAFPPKLELDLKTGGAKPLGASTGAPTGAGPATAPTATPTAHPAGVETKFE